MAPEKRAKIKVLCQIPHYFWMSQLLIGSPNRSIILFYLFFISSDLLFILSSSSSTFFLLPSLHFPSLGSIIVPPPSPSPRTSSSWERTQPTTQSPLPPPSLYASGSRSDSWSTSAVFSSRKSEKICDFPLENPGDGVSKSSFQ